MIKTTGLLLFSVTFIFSFGCKQRRDNASGVKDERNIERGGMVFVDEVSKWAVTCKAGYLHNGSCTALLTSRELRYACEEPDNGNICSNGGGGDNGGGDDNGGGGNGGPEWSLDRCSSIPEKVSLLTVALSPEFIQELQTAGEQVATFNLCTSFLRKFNHMLVNSPTLLSSLKGDTGEPILIMVATKDAAVTFDVPTLSIPWNITSETMTDIAEQVADSGINVCGEGRWVGGTCWYFGDRNKNCDETCDQYGKRYDSKTKTFAGSAGSLENCRKIATEFGHPMGNQADGWCYLNNSGCNKSQYHVNRCKTETTSTSKHSNINRFCACKVF